MRTRQFSWITALWLVAVPFVTLASSMITMDQEPHHHLVMRNNFVKIFNVKVKPGGSIVVHRHDGDTVAIAIGDQEVTVGIPGKPDVHQKNADGQVRLQASGYIHSTHVDGATAYHTVAVELLRPQTGGHNVCASVLAGQPLNCPDSPGKATSNDFLDSPLFESDQTRIRLVRIFPHQNLPIADSPEPRLIVTLDAGFVSSIQKGHRGSTLRPGDYVWLDKSIVRREFKNTSDNEERFIEFTFKSSISPANGHPLL